MQPLVRCLSVLSCDFYSGSGAAFWFDVFVFLLQILIFTVVSVQPLV